MSLRTTLKPIEIPAGVAVDLESTQLKVKGPKATLILEVNGAVDLKVDNNQITVQPPANDAKAITGTTCAHIKNMLKGVTEGFEKKLILVGVGYRAQLKGKELHLSLGFSHPVVFISPEGVALEVPSQTEILIKGSDKQKVGQVAAKIRDYRRPEPYKGKGIKYSDEEIIIKETKKK